MVQQGQGQVQVMERIDGEPKVYTIEEAAAILKVHPRTINRLLERGELRGFRVGRVWRISREALDAYIHGERGAAQHD
jgi:excisionase family DNA binding protein